MYSSGEDDSTGGIGSARERGLASSAAADLRRTEEERREDFTTEITEGAELGKSEKMTQRPQTTKS
jgi:hypothetical protein